jgi:ATP-dependent Clp protease protease subunit
MSNSGISEIDEIRVIGSEEKSAKEKCANDIFLTFCGNIDHIAVAQFLKTITRAVHDGMEHIHLLFQSNGGSVADGICLYNFFRSLPIPLTIYNTGTIRSAGIMSYLGAKHRKTSLYSTFVLHRCRLQNQSGSADQMKVLADTLAIEEARIETILRGHLDLTPEQWTDFSRYELVLTPEKAVRVGMADEIAEFSLLPHARFYAL